MHKRGGLPWEVLDCVGKLDDLSSEIKVSKTFVKACNIDVGPRLFPDRRSGQVQGENLL